MVKHKAPWSEYYNSTPTPSPLNGLDGSLPPWTREVVKTSQRAYTGHKPKGLHSKSSSWLEKCEETRKEYTNSTPSLSQGWMIVHSHAWMGEILKTSQRACTVRAYLDWTSMKHQEVWELHTSPPPPTPMKWGCLSPPLSLVTYNVPA